VLEVDAILRDGDATVRCSSPVADFKRMIGFEAAAACVGELRRAGRTEVRDGVEYVTFAMWEMLAPWTSPGESRSAGDHIAFHAVSRCNPGSSR